MYTIEKVSGREAFNAIVEKDGFNLKLAELPWGGEPMEVVARIAHDDKAFHVSMRCYETHCRAAVLEHEGEVCTDSCMEWFFSPCPEKRPNYFNMEVNPNGCILFNYGAGREGRVQTYRLPECAGMVAKVTENWWQISYSIPYDLVQEFAPEFTGASGSEIRMNMYRCGEKAEHDSYLVLYAPDVQKVPQPDYHRPEYFQAVRLG